jgi:hypothetical protein
MTRVRGADMAEVLSIHVEYGTLKPVQAILRKGGEEGEQWRDEANRGAWYAYMEMSQWDPQYNRYILIKCF